MTSDEDAAPSEYRGDGAADDGAERHAQRARDGPCGHRARQFASAEHDAQQGLPHRYDDAGSCAHDGAGGEQHGDVAGELPETLMHMPGDLGRAAIIRDMRPLSESDIVTVVDELFLPLVRYYEAQGGDTME